jgi:hypothetical protein
LRVYVASKFENPRAPEVAALLEAAGHVITYKWWGCLNFTQEQALLDYNGVTSADAFVLIVEDPTLKYSGAITEFGIAVGRHIPVYIMGNALDRNIFTLLPGVYRGIETLLQDIHVPA